MKDKIIINPEQPDGNHEENRKMLLDIGFAHTEEFFRWYNFPGIVALK